MVKLEITIKEIKSVDYESVKAIGTEISVNEVGKKCNKE